MVAHYVSIESLTGKAKSPESLTGKTLLIIWGLGLRFPHQLASFQRMPSNPIKSAIEVTEESFKGIGEGISHGVTLVTGMGVSAGEKATTATEESIQSAARETPRALGQTTEKTAEMGRGIDESVEDTKTKGLAEKIGEKLQGAKEQFQEGTKPNTKELRKAKSDISLL